MESGRLYGLFILILCSERSGVVAQDPEALGELEEHCRRMYVEWTDVNKYPKVECTKKQLEFFKSCHNYKPPDTIDDDYYPINDAAGPQLEPKSRRPDGGCERIDVLTATRTEWNQYRLAVNGTYNRLEDGVSQYQVFASQHRYAISPEAHNGPAFLCFHREYCSRFEGALRMQNPNVCLMYIDWTTIYPLDNVCDSVIFSDDYFGTSNGVLTGFWSHWRGYSPGCTGRISRNCNPNAKVYLYSDSSVNGHIQSYRSFPDWCSPRAPNFETAHGGPHVCVGGGMNNLACAVNDPIFWSHHTYVDYLFQRARNGETNQQNKVNNYPNWNDVPADQLATDPMRPFHDFGLRNIDGLSVGYDQRISYKTSRLPCSSDAQCNPAQDSMNALWCFNQRCTSKIKRRGTCGNKPNNACYQDSSCAGRAPVCRGGVCDC